MPRQAEDAKKAALQAAEEAREPAATVAMLAALPLLISAFVASAATVIGGRQRDDGEAVLMVER